MTPELIEEIKFRSSYGVVKVGAVQSVHLYHLLCRAIRATPGGMVVELGCNAGLTSVLIQKILNHLGVQDDRFLHVYDSFEGMPAQNPEGDKGTSLVEIMREGSIACTVTDVLGNFQMRGVEPTPVIHKGWFEDTLPRSLPDEIAFALLDGDFYDSIGISLAAVWPRMVSHGIVMIDDYDFPAIPGCRRAVDEFVIDKREKPLPLIGTNAAFIEAP